MTAAPDDAPGGPRPVAGAARASYSERLGVPLRWWALATMFLASLLVAFLVATPLWVAATMTALLVALVLTVFIGYGAARVVVGDGVLSAGRARIELSHLGEVRALDAEATRLLAGREADARAYLLIRPYLRQAVQVDITDRADPAPYWLVSSRRPSRLVAAIEAAREHSAAHGGVEDPGSAVSS
jgi:hypothetical protein